MKRSYSLRGLSYMLCYSAEDIAVQFQIHKKTARTWILSGDLPTIDSKKGGSALVWGYDLQKFIEKQNDKNKVKTKFDEFYCMYCHQPEVPLGRRIAIEQNKQQIRTIGLCQKTHKPMYSRYSLSQIGLLSKKFKIVPLALLYDSDNALCKIPNQGKQKQPKTEPLLLPFDQGSRE